MATELKPIPPASPLPAASPIPAASPVPPPSTLPAGSPSPSQFEQANQARDGVFHKLRWMRQDEPIPGYDRRAALVSLDSQR